MKKLLLAIVLIVGCEDIVQDIVTTSPIPDATSPIVVITFPVNNNTLDSTITVKADVIDDSDIASVKFLIDGTEAYTDTTSPYEYEWDVCVQATGTHIIMVIAEDMSSNIGWSDVLSYTINATYDCESVCGGDKVVDNCGTCDNDATNDCPKDCADVWGGTAELDDCGVCNNYDTQLAFPYGTCDCAGTPSGTATTDNCGTCDVDSTNDCPADCSGVFGGDKVVDNCGTCDNDTTNDCTADCNGDFGGNAVIDDCGICTGISEYVAGSCHDCAGTPYGTALCGCTDMDACNYNADANMDDESCEYAYEYHNCDYSCMNDVDGNGIADELQGTVEDIDGNIYNTVIIGDQVWMAENLKVKRYNNGDTLNVGICSFAWGAGSFDLGLWGGDDDPSDCEAAYQGIGSWDSQYLNDDPNIYGYYYNWYVIDEENICPDNYHIPTLDDVNILRDYLGGWQVAGDKIKSRGTIQNGKGLWNEPNTGTNVSGFSALPAGAYGMGTIGGHSVPFGYGAEFWINEEYSHNYASSFYTMANKSWIYGFQNRNKARGVSIRCLKD